MLPGRWFVLGCAAAAAVVLVAGRAIAMPLGLLGGEVLVTILSLFLLGSFKYQVHKNALTYGMLLVVSATFCGLRTSAWHEELATLGWPRWVRLHFLSFHGLDDLVHADTMLFILGLTLFVAVIAQTRLLEGVTYVLLRRYRGALQPTVVAVTAAVAVASGILGGVSLISLTIRTLVIVLMLAAAPLSAIRYAIMLCTAVTTICGVFSAYGEPPNLIMKANLAPNLGNDFFLYYCGPVAVVSYLVVASQLRQHLRPPHRPGRDGRDRRQRRRRAVPPGDAARGSADPGRAHRRARRAVGAGRAAPPGPDPRRRVGGDRARARTRARADPQAAARALRQRRSGRRPRRALRAGRLGRTRGRGTRGARGRPRRRRPGRQAAQRPALRR